MEQLKMNNLKLAGATSTTISWRDEVAYSNDAKSEGLEKLKEAIKAAKAALLISASSACTSASATRAKSAAGD
jgi:hypothetical protein